MFYDWHKMDDGFVDTKECKQGSVKRFVYQMIQVLRCFHYFFVLKTDRYLESHRATEAVKRVDESFPEHKYCCVKI